MPKIAHTPNDVKKRRAAFEERWKTFQGNMYDEKRIREEVFTLIKPHMLKPYFSKRRNPLFGYDKGEFFFSEEPFRHALEKAKADLSLFQMSETKVQKPFVQERFHYEQELKVYVGNDHAWCHTCFLTYQGVQMTVERWTVEGSPYGSYVITPAIQLPLEKQWVVTETYFFWIDLPRLLMDIALEYALCQEEFNYHMRQLKVFNMDSTVFNESGITLSDNPEEWMPSIENYFQMMKKRYNDTISLADLKRVGKFDELCREMDVNVEYRAGKYARFSDPSGERREGFFMVEGYVLYIEEFRYYTSAKNKCIIYPYHQRPEYSFTLNGSLGLHALVGYIKQMPEVCRQIDIFTESLNF